MLLQLINNNAFDRLAGALCNTLIHSLWQGILLTAIAGVIIICTRKTSSALRYNLLISAMLLFAAGVSATFVWQYDRSPVNAIDMPPVTKINNVQPAHAFLDARELSQPRLTITVNNFLSEHHNSIVFIWFLIVFARSLQLAFGLYGTYRLRRVSVWAAKDNWQQRLQLLADGLRIRNAVTLLESGLAKVPMVIGHLKPVILVPLGLLTALSAEEVEAILIHELAHIKRRDYLVNMLQSLMEIAFFFNPAVIWVSNLIKTERENCCDDLALAQNHNKINYIRALVSCEEYQASVPAYAMGFPGSKNSLLNRVKRMVNNRNYSLNLFEKTVLAVCLVVLGLGVSAFTAREHIQKALKSVVTAIHHDIKAENKVKVKFVVSDTTHKKQTTTLNDAIESLHQLQRDTIETTRTAELDALVHAADRLHNLQSALRAKLDTNKRAFDTFHAVGRELYRENLLTDTNHMSISLNERELIVNGVRMPADVHEKIYKQFGSGSYYDGSYGESGSRNNNSSKDYQRQGEEQHKWDAYSQQMAALSQQLEAERDKKLVADLLQDGLITDENNLNFTLNDKGIIINGKKQSDEIYKKYKDKYMPGKAGSGWSWNYSHHE